MPWKSSTQLAAASAVAASAGPRPASRRPRSAIAGRLATANTAERKRIVSRPPPACATPQARRKWSGAPPRLPSTMSKRSPSGWRPTKSGSASSSCGGQPESWTRRKAAVPAVSAVTPAANSRASSSRGAARAKMRGRGSTAVSAMVASGYAERGLQMPLLALICRAYLRVPLPEWAPVRGVPPHHRPRSGGLRGVRGEPAREGAPPGADPFQGLGVLLDRLRARRAEAGGRRGRRWSEERGEEREEAGEEGRRRQRVVNWAAFGRGAANDAQSAQSRHTSVTLCALGSP